MTIFRIGLDCTGDNFSPASVLPHLVGDFNIQYQHEATDIPQYNFGSRIKRMTPRTPYGYGALTFQHPLEYGLNHNGSSYENWYVDIVEQNFELFKKHQVEELCIEIDVFYVDQCFIEVLDSECLRRLYKAVDIRLSIPMNVYQLKAEQEIVNMLLAAGYERDMIQETLYRGSDFMAE